MVLKRKLCVNFDVWICSQADFQVRSPVELAMNGFDYAALEVRKFAKLL